MNYLIQSPISGSTLCKCTFTAVGLVGLCNQAQAAEKKATKQPNVIFVFSDDQRFNSLGITGDPVTQTPNLDNLAREGAFFENTFITSPISGPSRANIFTAQWERKNHIGFSNVSHNNLSEEAFNRSWLMQLKGAGYSTAFIGKHHVSIVDNNAPLEENIDFCYYGKGHLGFYLKNERKANMFSNLKNDTQVEGLFEATEAYLKQTSDTDYFFENADEDIKHHINRRDPDKPFCAWINFNLPHAASIGGMGSKEEDPEYYKTLYDDKLDQIPFPDNYPQEISLPEYLYNKDDVMKYYVTWEKDRLLSEKLKMNRAVYAIDQFVGNLRALLEELGEADNTIIIYCADNGLYHGEHGLGGKSILYEEAVRVPMLIYSPFMKDKDRGKFHQELVVGQDIPATILDMCGVAIPDTYQGESMLPILEGRKTPWREYVFLENLFTDQGYPREEAVRSDKFKYTRFFSKDNDRLKYLPLASVNGEQPIYEELYDIVNDPKETTNLAQDPRYADIMEEYRVRCQELVTELAK